jgi:hypothetical protein
MRENEYDFVKGVAIVFVVLLHSISYSDLYAIFAPWHIWQAIPLFVIVSGALHAKSAEVQSLSHLAKIRKSILKLILPALVIWVIQLILLYFIKGDIDGHRMIELFKQGGFGAGGYFIYIAIQNIFFGIVFYSIIKKYKRSGLIFIGAFSVLFDIVAYKYSIDEEMYRVIATRYAFFYAIGLAYVRGLLDFNRFFIFVFWVFGVVWLAIIQFFLFDFHPVYPSWHSHTALSGFVAFGFFLALIKIYNYISSCDIARLVCTLGRSSYYIFLVQMTYFWSKRWFVSNNYYPQYGYEMVAVELVICLTVGMVYSVSFKYIASRSILLR